MKVLSGGCKSARTRRFLWWLGGLTFAGILLRFLVLLQVIPLDPAAFQPAGTTDMATYQDYSSKILSGKYVQVFYYQPFYYAIFLPFWKLLIGNGAWAAGIGNVLCAGGLIFYAGLSGALLKGRKAGLIVAFLAVFSTMLTFYVPYALLEIQQSFWFVLLFYLTLRGMRGKSWYLWGSVGIVLGIAILSRGNAWCFLPILLACAVFWNAEKSWKRRMIYGCCVLGFALLMQLPFISWNTILLHRLSGPSTAGAAVLALGNTPEAPPGYLVYPEAYEIWMKDQESYPVMQRIYDWAKSEPLGYLELQVRKFLLYWDALEIPNNVSLEYNGLYSSLLKMAFIPTGFLLFLSFSSLCLQLPSLWKKKGILALVLMIGAYACATAAFYILARFRVPSLGLFCIMGGIFPVVIHGAIRMKGLRMLLLPGILAMLCGYFVVYQAYGLYRMVLEPRVMKVARPHGIWLDDPGNGKKVVYDHGPRQLGGWLSYPIQEGMRMRKRLILPPEFPQRGRLEFSFLSGGDDEFLLTVNEKTQGFRTKEGSHQNPALVRYSMDVVVPSDGVFDLRFWKVGNPRQTGVNIDFQRNYGRSYLNDSEINGEIVLKLIGFGDELEKKASE